MSTVGYALALRLNNLSDGDWHFSSPVHGAMAPKKAKLSPATQNQHSKEAKSTEPPVESLTGASSATAGPTIVIPVQPAVWSEDLDDCKALMELLFSRPWFA